MCLGIPGRIVSLGASELENATVEFGGVTRSVNMVFVPEAKAGDYVVVHAGFAISLVDEEQARETFEYLQKLGEELPGDAPPSTPRDNARVPGDEA